MPQRTHDVYASAPMRGLLADETAAYMPQLRRCAGTRALLLSAAAQDRPPNPPYLQHWVTLWLNQDAICGDIRGSIDEPLPFLDDAFDVVLLRHALEPAPALLEEVVRVLAPGGVLMLTGINPLSAWTPWWQWQTYGSAVHARSPLHLVTRLRRADLQVERMQRVGKAIPVASTAANGGHSALGGGYVLIARKQRPASIPTRLRPKPVARPVNAGLAAGARRHSSV